MKISSLNLNSYKPSFKSTTRTTYFSDFEGQFTLPSYSRGLHKTYSFSASPDVKMVSSNSTRFFRSDINWKDLGYTFNKEFPKGKVNVYDFACSDGSEAYSIIITLLEQLGQKQAQRFLPIIASDIDPEIVAMAKSGKIKATEEDLFNMENIIQNGGISKYFDVRQLGVNDYILSAKEILKKNVIFEQENIKQGLEKIQKGENNIVLARNFWKYLSSENLAAASWRLGEKADENMLLIIGNFDSNHGNLPFFLTSQGFVEGNYNENILTFDKKSKSIVQTKDEKSWESYVNSWYNHYVPLYIKRF